MDISNIALKGNYVLTQNNSFRSTCAAWLNPIYIASAKRCAATGSFYIYAPLTTGA
jgi:hypothetical protein